MKAKILSIFAAIAISLGSVAVANSASASIGVSPAVVTSSQANDGIQLASHYRPYRFRRGLRKRRMCRRLYILGFHYGNRRARRAYYRHCVRRFRRSPWYRGGPGYGWF